MNHLAKARIHSLCDVQSLTKSAVLDKDTMIYPMKRFYF